jgi:hypothetical protein
MLDAPVPLLVNGVALKEVPEEDDGAPYENDDERDTEDPDVGTLGGDAEEEDADGEFDEHHDDDVGSYGKGLPLDALASNSQVSVCKSYLECSHELVLILNGRIMTAYALIDACEEETCVESESRLVLVSHPSKSDGSEFRTDQSNEHDPVVQLKGLYEEGSRIRPQGHACIREGEKDNSRNDQLVAVVLRKIDAVGVSHGTSNRMQKKRRTSE